MSGLRLAGALWMFAGLCCVGLLLFVFVGEKLDNLGILLQEPALPALVLGGAIVGLFIGVVLIAFPGPRAVRWSTIAGVAWLIVFGSVALTRLDNPGPLLSSSLITGFGVAGAIAAYAYARDGTGRRQDDKTEPASRELASPAPSWPRNAITRGPLGVQKVGRDRT